MIDEWMRRTPQIGPYIKVGELHLTTVMFLNLKSCIAAVMTFFTQLYNRDGSPPEIFNLTLMYCVIVFGTLLGSARGYDEGYIGGIISKNAFKETFGLNNPNQTAEQLANLKSNITSMVQLGSIGGCLMAIYNVDKFGRIRTLQSLCVVWAVGAIIQITSKSVGQLYAGRAIEGIAMGHTAALGPCYLAEISPKSIRGLCGCMFAAAVYLGSFFANFINYGCALHMPVNSANQWIVPTAIKILVAGLLFIGSCFCPESPRWLVKEGNIEKSQFSLSKIRHLPPDHPYILSEVSDIQEQLDAEMKATGEVSRWAVVKELFLVSSIRFRLLLSLSAQVLGQWSMAGSITVYMPELVALVGVKGTRKLLYSSVLGVVKFSSSLISAFFIIDLLGRKKALYIGITIQLLSTLYFAIFLQIVPDATKNDYIMTSSQKHAGVGALAMLYIAGVGWTMGWNSIQYLISSEMLPLRVRNVGSALIMAFHFCNQYGNTKAMPTMLLNLTSAGTFFFAVGVLVIGLFWSWFFLPNIAGRSLESMEEVFSLPWYIIGRRGSDLCPDNSGVAHVNEAQAGQIEIKVDQEFVEFASNASNIEEIKDLEKGT